MRSIAPSVLSDPDDTGKAIYTLNLLGRQTNPCQMIDQFKTSDGHFQTYAGERNVSFSSNCNALNALLHAPDVEIYATEIISTTKSLCDLWWRGEVDDKWVRTRST